MLLDLARLLRGRGAPRPATGAGPGVAGGGGARARRCAVHRQDRDAHRGAARARPHRADRRGPGSGARARGARGGRSRPQRHAAGDRSEPVHDRRLDGRTHGAVLVGAEVGRRRVRRSGRLGAGRARHPDERRRRRRARRRERDRPARGCCCSRAPRGWTDDLPDGLEPVALVVLADRVRPDAAQTLRYFAEQQVRGEGAQRGRAGDGGGDRGEPRARGRGSTGRRAHTARRRSRCARRGAGAAQRVRPRHAAAEADDGAGRCKGAVTRSR